MNPLIFQYGLSFVLGVLTSGNAWSTSMANHWFSVDKDGLSKLIEQQCKGRLIAELLQNALDENVTRVSIRLTPLKGRPLVELVVGDDSPDGFRNLDHAYTLFADSYKKADPTKRGRFNLGEKLVLALCRSAVISSTTGSVVFDESGHRRVKPRSKRERGSEFRATIRMTKAEFDEAITYLNGVLVPDNVIVTVNDQILAPHKPVHTFEATLDTEVAADNGILRCRSRKTTVELYPVKAGEIASIYELGLPVVETGDKWHVNVCQKVLLNLNRDNVRPAFLHRLRTIVFNEMHAHLSSDEANQTWVQEATSHEDCSATGIEKYLDLRFGQNRASFDPSDPEAGKQVVAHGGTLITGSMLNARQWAKAKQAHAIKASSYFFPSPKPYSDDPNAPPEEVLDSDRWTTGMRNIADYATFLAKELMGVALCVKITKAGGNFLACYGHGELTFNLATLGHKWFDQGPAEAVDELLIHEFGHEYSGDHLCSEYHEALCRIGAKLKNVALNQADQLTHFWKPN